MTLRTMPALPRISARTGLASEVPPAALANWQAEIQAADKSDDNVISILGPIGEDFFGDGITARRVAGALRAIGPHDVTVHINSPGGDIFEGLAIYNLLREHKQRVTVKVLGMAASAASVVAMAGDEIQAARAGFIMIHNVWVVAVGNRNDLRDYADIIEPVDRALADVYAARSGLDAKDVAKMMDRETRMGGSEAVEKGFADTLLPADEIAKGAKASGSHGVHAAARQIDIILAKARVPRSERTRLIEELKSGTLEAAEDALSDDGVSEGLQALLADANVT